MWRGGAVLRVFALACLCVTPSLAEVQAAQTVGASKEQLDLQMHAWTEFMHAKVAEAYVEQNAKVNDVVERTKEDLHVRAQSFAQHASSVQATVASWMSRYSNSMTQCFAGSGLSRDVHTELKQELRETWGPKSENGTQMLLETSKVVKNIPVLNMMSQHFDERPDWALWALGTVSQIPMGKTLLSAYFRVLGEHPEDGTQELLQVTTGSRGILDKVTSLSNLVNPTSLFDRMGSLSSVSEAAAGGGTALGSFSGSSLGAIDAGQGMIMPFAETGSKVGEQGSSLAGILADSASTAFFTLAGAGDTSNSVSSLIGSLPFSLLQLETTTQTETTAKTTTQAQALPLTGVGEAGLYGAGLGGADGSSGSSISSIASMQLSSGEDDRDAGQHGSLNDSSSGGSSSSAKGGGGGGGGTGCCVAILFVVIMLGVGCAGEYYIKNMHKFDEDKYEQYLVESINQQVEQFNEYLKLHPDKFGKLQQQIEMGMMEGESDVVMSGHPARPHKPEDAWMHLPLDYVKIQEQVQSAVDAAEAEVEVAREQGQFKKELQAGSVARTSAKSVVEAVPDSHEQQNAGHREAGAMESSDNSMKPGEAIGKMLGIFYAGYNAVPALVSKHFGFYFVLMLMSIIISAAMGGF